MNNLERFIYDKIKNNPWLKEKVVHVYQKLFSIIPTKAIQPKYEINVREGFYFGFHDKCPWSIDNKIVLAHKFDPSSFRMPKKGEEV